jgi:acetyltransferase-like isoleucine patch superfamily enzyme
MLKLIAKKIIFLVQRRRQKIKHVKEIGRPSYISVTAKFTFHSNISIGKYCRIGSDCHIDGAGGVEIQDGSILASNVSIISSSHVYDQALYLPYTNTDVKKRVVIGKGVWIGRGAIILPGVHVADAAIIAAGSVVTKNVEFGNVVGGNPAVYIKNRQDISEVKNMIKMEKYYLKSVFKGFIKRDGRPNKTLEIME